MSVIDSRCQNYKAKTYFNLCMLIFDMSGFSSGNLTTPMTITVLFGS